MLQTHPRVVALRVIVINFVQDPTLYCLWYRYYDNRTEWGVSSRWGCGLGFPHTLETESTLRNLRRSTLHNLRRSKLHNLRKWSFMFHEFSLLSFHRKQSSPNTLLTVNTSTCMVASFPATLDFSILCVTLKNREWLGTRLLVWY